MEPFLMKKFEKEPKAPQNLSFCAKKRWRALVSEYRIRDSAGLQICEEYCRLVDRAAAAREVILREGAMIKDRFGQQREHPAVVTERGAVRGMLACLRALNLDIQPLNPGPGRPAEE
jgi:phage terminase small subunit